MSIKSRTILKSKFETGDVPTQDDFHNWLDSFIHITEDLINDLTTGGTQKALTAQQGVELKSLIDTLQGELDDAIYLFGNVDAINVLYDNLTSLLDAENVQDAIDKLKGEIDDLWYFVSNIEITGGSSFYQTIKDSTTTYNQRGAIKFLGSVEIADDAVGDETEVTIKSAGVHINRWFADDDGDNGNDGSPQKPKDDVSDFFPIGDAGDLINYHGITSIGGGALSKEMTILGCGWHESHSGYSLFAIGTTKSSESISAELVFYRLKLSVRATGGSSKLFVHDCYVTGPLDVATTDDIEVYGCYVDEIGCDNIKAVESHFNTDNTDTTSTVIAASVNVELRNCTVNGSIVSSGDIRLVNCYVHGDVTCSSGELKLEQATINGTPTYNTLVNRNPW